jgi:hypothetical protein
MMTSSHGPVSLPLYLYISLPNHNMTSNILRSASNSAIFLRWCVSARSICSILDRASDELETGALAGTNTGAAGSSDFGAAGSIADFFSFSNTAINICRPSVLFLEPLSLELCEVFSGHLYLQIDLPLGPPSPWSIFGFSQLVSVVADFAFPRRARTCLLPSAGPLPSARARTLLPSPRAQTCPLPSPRTRSCPLPFARAQACRLSFARARSCLLPSARARTAGFGPVQGIRGRDSPSRTFLSPELFFDFQARCIDRGSSYTQDGPWRRRQSGDRSSNGGSGSPILYIREELGSTVRHDEILLVVDGFVEQHLRSSDRRTDMFGQSGFDELNCVCVRPVGQVAVASRGYIREEILVARVFPFVRGRHLEIENDERLFPR